MNFQILVIVLWLWSEEAFVLREVHKEVFRRKRSSCMQLILKKFIKIIHIHTHV